MIVTAPPAAADVPRCDFVLDAGIPATWLLLADATTYGDRVQRRMIRDTVAVPASWTLDLADLLRAAERRGRTTPADADGFLAKLADFRFVIDGESPLRWWPAVLGLSRTRRVPVHKAAYLELARRLNLPLATEDPTLTRHAAAAGVPIFSP